MDAISRRRFFTRSAAGIAAASAAGRAMAQPANEQLRIAVVGVGGMGASNIRNLADEAIVALCDVDDEYAARLYDGFPDAKRYRDYREMLADDPDIDGVVIATPDHTHAVIAMACMEAGKHVYCQKPLTHNIYEARRLTEAAAASGVVTQMGIQGHSGPGVHQLRAWIQDGVIGEVREVDAWCSLTYYPWGHASWSSPLAARPDDTPPVPETLDWDLWLGPAPERPYHPCYHPRTWRSWWDFGCGMMGDRGAHTFDPIFWALGLGHPLTVEGSSTDLNGETFPVAGVMRYEFPARGAMPPVTLTWYDGLRPPRPKALSQEDELGHPEGGVLFKGSEGYLTCGVYGENPRLVPAARMAAFSPPTLDYKAGLHEHDWTRAIREGGKAGAAFAYAGPLTEVCHLGNIARRMDAKLEWDPDTMTFPNAPEANPWAGRPYRDGWAL